jgi:hypothetical protein
MTTKNPDELTLDSDNETNNTSHGQDESAAVAAAMGFSSFGNPHYIDREEATPPCKKRRFNPGEAAGAQIAEEKQGPVTDQGAQARGLEEGGGRIGYADSDDDDDDNDDDGGAKLEGTTASKIGENQQRQQVWQPQRHQQQWQPYPYQQGQYQYHPQQYGQQLWQQQQHGQGYQQQRLQHRRGQHNPNWYIDYYDPSSNANPWERLEKRKGLEPVGSWLR